MGQHRALEAGGFADKTGTNSSVAQKPSPAIRC